MVSRGARAYDCLAGLEGEAAVEHLSHWFMFRLQAAAC